MTNQKPTGDISVNNHANGDFDVVISNISDANGVSAVKLPIWAVKNNQDDIIWYDGAKQNDGTYKVTVKLSDHRNERGAYNIHLYYVESNGQLQGVVGTQVTIPEARLSGNLHISNQSAAVFDILVTNLKEVKSQPRLSAPTEFTLDAVYQVRYDKALYADGHQWISYLSYGSLRRYVLID